MAISITHGKRERHNIKDTIYHITCRCNNREYLFKKQKGFEKYISILQECQKKYGFILHDYSNLNNHLHLIIKLGDIPNISKIMHSINRWYAMWYNKEYGRTGHFWEERFYAELITSDLQLLSTMVYLHLNPVKAQLCNKPTDWEYSGALYYLKGVKNTLITPPDIYRSLGTTNIVRQKVYKRIMEPYHARLKQ